MKRHLIMENVQLVFLHRVHYHFKVSLGFNCVFRPMH
jgi:hypothetical protein